MQITLTCVAFQDAPLPDAEVVEFEAGSLSIGRASDNDFVIKDPDHFASRHHAKILVEDGRLYIEDTSNNGTLINDSFELNPGQRHTLDDGDTLLIGECTIRVGVLAPAPIDIDDFAAFIDAALEAPEAVPEAEAPAAAQVHANSALEQDYAADSHAIDVFLQELQVDPTTLKQDIVEIMGVAGIVLRTLTKGVMDMLKARTSVKRTFGMDTTKIKGVQNNALKFSVSAEEALGRLLNQETGFLNPLQSVEEAVHDAQAHQVAMVSGMNAAIAALLARFDPAHLEQTLGQGFAFSKKARYWDLYTEQYAQIAKDSESHFNDLFAEEFRKTYEEQVRKLQDKP